MGFGSLLKFALAHPVGRRQKLGTIARIIDWQLKSRFGKAVLVDWIEGSRVIVANGMHGMTGNIYLGLHEFADMAFAAHVLRPDDLFLDVGANVGSYTILASKVSGARVVAIEPDDHAAEFLLANCALNGMYDQVSVVRKIAGAVAGPVQFTIGKGTVNQVVDSSCDKPTREMLATTIDEVIGSDNPLMIKLDVEGYEEHALRGAKATLGDQMLKAVATELRSPSVTRLLQEQGFEQVYYDPSTRLLSNTENEYKHNNALWVRDRTFVEERLRSAKKINLFGVKMRLTKGDGSSMAPIVCSCYQPF